MTSKLKLGGRCHIKFPLEVFFYRMIIYFMYVTFSNPAYASLQWLENSCNVLFQQRRSCCLLQVQSRSVIEWGSTYTGGFKLPCQFWGCICCKQLQSSQITIFTLLFTGRYNIGVLRRWFLNIEWEIFPKQFFFHQARSKLKEIHITANTHGFVFTTWQEYTVLTTISPMNEEQKATYNTAYDMAFATLSACVLFLWQWQ